jgi:hypothetical protein
MLAMVAKPIVQKVKYSDEHIFWKAPVQHVVYLPVFMPGL